MPAAVLDRLYREDAGRILATLIRLVGDFDRAEEAMHDAFAVALEQWPLQGIPVNPVAWIVSAGRNKAIDRIRREEWLEQRRDEVARSLPGGVVIQHPALEAGSDDTELSPDSPLQDDLLRLVFTCCHPSLAVEAQVALTLRTVCGLETGEIARAFLIPVATMAQRLARAKQKIKGARIPYRVPPEELLPERADAVLATVYLVFNEGYAPTSGPGLVRADLAASAVRLGRQVAQLLPRLTEPKALLALMLLQDSRRATRTTPGGELVLLEDQDRRLWDLEQIAEGVSILEALPHGSGSGFYALQAAIAAAHARATRAQDTDWRAIERLYDALYALRPGPVIELNRAVAVAMSEGPARGLALVDVIASRENLRGYHLLPAVRADFLRRLGRFTEAAEAYRQAMELASNAAERRFLEKRWGEVSTLSGRQP